MLVGLTKFVDFTYCKSCKYYKKDQHDEPCNDCLTVATNEGSSRPINYKEKKERKEKNV